MVNWLEPVDHRWDSRGGRVTYDRNALPAFRQGLRLLPWESDTGKPCFLSTGNAHGTLAQLADEVEADQLRNGAAVLAGAVAVAADREAGESAQWRALRATAEALGGVLRIADSQGARLAELGSDGSLTGDHL